MTGWVIERVFLGQTGENLQEKASGGVNTAQGASLALATPKTLYLFFYSSLLAYFLNWFVRVVFVLRILSLLI